jgi:hypothetical protein
MLSPRSACRLLHGQDGAAKAWGRIIAVIVGSLIFVGRLALAVEVVPPETLRSPVNQVFQFVQSGECSAWADGSKTTATAYLWIPENCPKLRGVLILCANVPEHMLVGDQAIRDVCAANDLGIVWCARTFYNFKAKNEDKTDVAFLQQLLDGLAKVSGYNEVATVPWLPMGESGHLLMVDALVEAAPERCIAGIWIKNCHLPPKNREVPAFVAYGSAQEWSQDKTDYRVQWKNIDANYARILNERKSNPDWPFSFVIDGTSGHFDCSERLTRLFARYIDLVAKARLSDDGSANLKKIDLTKGYLADLPVPGHEGHPVTAYADAPADGRALPWFLDKAFAEEAQSIAAINWNSDSQLPAFTDNKGNVFPYTFNGITMMSLDKKPEPLPDGTTPPMLETEADGITFTVQGTMLDKLPANFFAAGQPLAQVPGTPTAEWLCGCVEPLGGGKFRIALDRTWPSPIYVALRHAGTDSVRAVVQPGQITREGNTDGAPQKITFAKLDDVKAGTDSVPLQATSDSGLPVSFFVDAGPAIIKDGKVVFTKIPSRTKFPVAVTVVAWQWGRHAEPKIKRADLVRQTFHILAP